MRSEEYSRRTVIRSTAGALFMCATCSQSVAALAGEQTIDSPAQVEEKDECRESLPELEWNELDVAQTPYVVRYQDGYRDDAEMLHQIAKENYQSIQDAYPHTPTGAVTLDLYPAKHYIHPHDSSSYDHVSRSIPMVTPSEYDGRRDTSNEKLMESYYTHIVIHEYTHAPQLQALRGDGTDGSNAFASPRWFIEGFAEAITVYKTNDDLRERYHNRHDSEHMMERVANGHGYLMMMNADVWRGSMHVFRYLFDEYGVEAVADVYAQDAENFVEAMEMALGITPVDLQFGWLQYASDEYGGDYSEDLEKLDSSPRAENNKDSDDGNNITDSLLGGAVGTVVGGVGGYATRAKTNASDTTPGNAENESE